MKLLRCKCDETIPFEEKWNGLAYIVEPFYEVKDVKLFIDYCPKCGEYLLPCDMELVECIDMEE